MSMTSSDRNALIRIVRGRARLARTETAEREKILLNEIQELIQAEFSAQDMIRGELVEKANAAIAEMNRQLVHEAALLGVPKRFAPSVMLGYESRSWEFSNPERRAQLHKLAGSRLAALKATALRIIEQGALDAEEKLLTGGLESSEARAVVDALPTAGQLMSPLSLDDIGVKGWQPPDDAAAALLAPQSAADRRRIIIRRAIERDPGASDRQIGKLTGSDHKTVAKYRVGEFPSQAGEFPSAIPGGETP